jgi:hypothetical protein
MHHRLIADLGLEILSLEILSLKILNKIFALIRIAHLDYTLSASKKNHLTTSSLLGGEHGWRDSQLSTERIEGLAAQASPSLR